MASTPFRRMEPSDSPSPGPATTRREARLSGRVLAPPLAAGDHQSPSSTRPSAGWARSDVLRSGSPPHLGGSLLKRILVATDRSESAGRAVDWAADMAGRFDAELVLLQVLVPENAPGTEAGAAEATRASYAAQDLAKLAPTLAGSRRVGKVVVDSDPARAIVEAAEQEKVDVVVVGNLGMSGRKEFLLGNVPNRVSHNARCTVIIVNTAMLDGDRRRAAPSPMGRASVAEETGVEGQ